MKTFDFVEVGNLTFFKGGHDINGNPLYIVNRSAFLTPEEFNTMTESERMETAKKRANSIGFRKCRRTIFLDCFIGQSYNLGDTARHIVESRNP